MPLQKGESLEAKLEGLVLLEIRDSSVGLPRLQFIL